MEALLVNLSEAAKILRLDNNKMSELLQRGEVPAYKDGKNWKIPVPLLKKYVEDKAISEAEVRRKRYEEKV